jgi:hypothetical protein
LTAPKEPSYVVTPLTIRWRFDQEPIRHEEEK